jgi:hypothetical protein
VPPGVNIGSSRRNTDRRKRDPTFSRAAVDWSLASDLRHDICRQTDGRKDMSSFLTHWKQLTKCGRHKSWSKRAIQLINKIKTFDTAYSFILFVNQSHEYTTFKIYTYNTAETETNMPRIESIPLSVNRALIFCSTRTTQLLSSLCVLPVSTRSSFIAHTNLVFYRKSHNR